jgi:hypothetical protein
VRIAPFTLLAMVLLSSCREELTSPAECPALCPGGSPQVVDEILSPISGADSSFRGYVQPTSAPSLLISNGLEGFEERAIVRFPRLGDSVSVRDTLRAYTIDSVAFGLSLAARDTTVGGLSISLYRLPITIDSTTGYADVDPFFVPANLVGVIAVPDTLHTGPLRLVLSGTDLSRVAIPPADTGVLALGLRIDAPTPTGARVGAIASGAGPAFQTFATLDVPDTGTARLRTFTLSANFNSYVLPPQPLPDTTLLAVGGEPSARTLLRFELPPAIRDSANIVRATLELTPVSPIGGLPTDPVLLQARAVVTDVGAKSPVTVPVVGGVPVVPTDTVERGATAVSLEIVRVLELWRNSRLPAALMVSVAPSLEAGTFSRPVFYSTRAADPAVRPRLRISFLRTFPFENP